MDVLHLARAVGYYQLFLADSRWWSGYFVVVPCEGAEQILAFVHPAVWSWNSVGGMSPL